MILAGFLFVYFRFELSFKSLFLLALIGGLGTLNRLDTFLLYIPVIVHGLFVLRGIKALAVLSLGFLPLITWEIFSLLYYGFLVPNTAYAKLGVGVSNIELFQQGLYYFWNSVRWDTITLLTMVIAIPIFLVTREVRHLFVALGISFYLLYILAIGGDFMSGRFLSAPLFAAVILLSTSRFALPDRAALAAVATITLISFASLHPPELSGPPLFSGVDYGSKIGVGPLDDGIADERAAYYQTTGLLNSKLRYEMPDDKWAAAGRLARIQGQQVVIRGGIGFFGVFAGPEVHIVDRYALADPLLARLPATTPWRIGHFEREIPEGYLETLSTGQNRITDKDIAELYDKLSVITKGKLFDRNRLIAIWKFNTNR